MSVKVSCDWYSYRKLGKFPLKVFGQRFGGLILVPLPSQHSIMFVVLAKQDLVEFFVKFLV